MKTYELTTVLSVKDQQMQEGKAAVEQELGKFDFSIEATDDMGQRVLAYPINKEEQGHYFCYTVSGDRQKTEALRAALSLSPGLLRFLIVDPLG